MPVITFYDYQFSVKTFVGGYTGGAGKGSEWLVTYLTPGTSKDILSLNIVTPTQTLVLAAGDVIGSSPTACLALANRVYYLSGNSLYFSALGDTTQFEQQGIGAGYIDMSNQFAQAEPLQGLASYQGKLAIFARNSIQIWAINADPTQFAQIQVLPNTGTFAPLSVQSIGDLDVIYLYDTGVRSLRVRDSSLNAVLLDIGTPIDALVQAALSTQTNTQKTTACSAFEPVGGRYWLYAAGTIFVLSYYPSSKIAAWSTYKPTWNSGNKQMPFIPLKFELLNGQIYSVDGMAIYQYGGANNTTYDASVVTVETPLYDIKTSATLKKAKAIDAAISGTWALSFSREEYSPQNNQQAFVGNASTFTKGGIPVTGDGYHFRFYAQTTGSEGATISSLIFHYQQANEK